MSSVGGLRSSFQKKTFCELTYLFRCKTKANNNELSRGLRSSFQRADPAR